MTWSDVCFFPMWLVGKDCRSLAPPIKEDMAEREQKLRSKSNGWERFRRVCALSAMGKAPHPPVAEFKLTELSVSQQEQLTQQELLLDLYQQYDLQRRLALEFARALSDVEVTQERIEQRGQRELDARLEAQVLELAICEEAYEIVCEEVESLRRELRQEQPE